jgi:hypothetical protein
MSKYKITVLLLALGFSSYSAGSELPSGWRFPTTEDLSGNFIRKVSEKDYIVAQEDFNDDGLEDYAYIVKSTKFSGEALLLKYSKKGDYKWKVLDTIEWGKEYPNVSVSMGVDVVPPGEYKTACGKGYWNCKSDEVPVLKLNIPAISYFRFESAASFFYWDRNSKTFKRIWVSD